MTFFVDLGAQYSIVCLNHRCGEDVNIWPTVYIKSLHELHIL